MGKRHELTCTTYESLDHADCNCMRGEIERLRAGLTKIKDGVNEPCGWAMDDLWDYCVELLAPAQTASEPEPEGNMTPEEARDMIKNHLYNANPAVAARQPTCNHDWVECCYSHPDIVRCGECGMLKQPAT